MLREAVEEVCFSADDLKTVSFAVDSEYENEEYNDSGRTTYRRVFAGKEGLTPLKIWRLKGLLWYR